MIQDVFEASVTNLKMHQTFFLVAGNTAGMEFFFFYLFGYGSHVSYVIREYVHIEKCHFEVQKTEEFNPLTARLNTSHAMTSEIKESAVGMLGRAGL